MTHGRRSFRQRRCICDVCREASRSYEREYARRRRRRDGRTVRVLAPCGTRASYVRGCRCTPCAAANRFYYREHKRLQRTVRVGKRLDAAPLRRALDAWLRADAVARKPDEERGLTLIERATQLGKRYLVRLHTGQTATVDEFDADRICYAIGVHPIGLWPNQWLDYNAEEVA